MTAIPIAIVRLILHGLSIPGSCDHCLQLPAGFPNVFACWKPAITVANGNFTIAQVPELQSRDSRNAVMVASTNTVVNALHSAFILTLNDC